MKSLALILAIFSAGQGAPRLPLTIEVRQEVWVIRNSQPSESRGVLYLGSSTVEPFRLHTGQRFVMMRRRSEGGCRIRFQGREYEITSCPWLEGFRDHQSDVFKVIKEK